MRKETIDGKTITIIGFKKILVLHILVCECLIF
jgi:hypothetical protein